nr:hypothetical protein [Brevundimonas diminuta]
MTANWYAFAIGVAVAGALVVVMIARQPSVPEPLHQMVSSVPGCLPEQPTSASGLVETCTIRSRKDDIR